MGTDETRVKSRRRLGNKEAEPLQVTQDSAMMEEKARKDEGMRGTLVISRNLWEDALASK